jgi:hypothetical protein
METETSPVGPEFSIEDNGQEVIPRSWGRWEMNRWQPGMAGPASFDRAVIQLEQKLEPVDVAKLNDGRLILKYRFNGQSGPKWSEGSYNPDMHDGRLGAFTLAQPIRPGDTELTAYFWPPVTVGSLTDSMKSR